jgi:thiol:disulfide interchange protein
MRIISRLLWVLPFLLLAGCGVEETSTKVEKKTRATGMAVSALFAPLSLDQALEQARSDGKLVMVDVYTEWCGWCKVLDDKTWPDAEVQAWLREKTVPIKLDAEKDVAVAKKYKVDSFPQMLFIKPDGTLAGRLVGYVPPHKFVAEATAALAGKSVD